jgi:hypothetical protein
MMVEISIDLKNLSVHQLARRERLQSRSMLCKPLSLEGRLVSELEADRKALMRSLIVDFEDKPLFLRTQAHLVPDGDRS